MNLFVRIFSKTSLTFSALVILVALTVTLSQVYASNFTFTKTKIQIENNAGVHNTTDTEANTGGNTTNTNGNSSSTVVQTGNAGSETIICNDVNHTVINAHSGQSCPSGTNPTPTNAPQPTPTQTPGCTENCGGSSGGSSGGSNGSSNSSGSNSSSSEQGVLGASTMASTGTFDASLMNTLFALGTCVLGAGFFSFKKERRV